jgi:DNA mismatch repair protein MutL
MSSKIQILPLDLINLIAAGEVIDSLAAVVRELVDNSLDAGADRIMIAIFPELWRIQVADNGSGMDLTNLRLCAKAHSTSKIYQREDLWRINSLGFRGEALHSIAQVGELEILSCAAEDYQGIGWRILYHQGEVKQEEIAAIAPGTIVTVSNLFGNVPVRRKGLPSPSQQLKSIQSLIQQIALCHPQVTWQVFQNQDFWFQISPGQTAKQILPQILKSVRLIDLEYLSLEIPTPNSDHLIESHSKIELVIGLPDRCYRGRADWVKLAVNGRLVRSPELEQTILASFSRTLPKDHYPICFCHLHTCPTEIDWNRHPAKTEIYLNSLTFWQEQINQAIEQALRINPNNLPDTIQNQRVKELLKTSEPKKAYRVTSKNNSDFNLIELKAVAQIHNTYIVAEYPSGLWLVEQHIAHERILYEKIQEHWELIPLESPIILSQLTFNQIEQLQNLGLEIEPFGEELSAIRNAPLILSQREDLAEALRELSRGGNIQEAQVATACRSAIRNGTPLKLAQMQDILDQWKQTRNPRTCPHGRPIYLPLEETSLARFFRRHWVIGKSHGI